MRWILLTASFLFSSQIIAGCIGPVIMGQCKGQSVQWKTHAQPSYDSAPVGVYYDRRGTKHQEENYNDVDPFTGRDANDSDWHGNSDGMPVYDLNDR